MRLRQGDTLTANIAGPSTRECTPETRRMGPDDKDGNR